MAENEKYTPTKVEDALDWGKLGVKILTSLGAMIVSGLTIKYTIDEMSMKKNDPDRLSFSKYCPTCKKHTVHKETK